MSWEIISHIIFWVFFAFILIVFIKDKVFIELWKGTKDFFRMLWNAAFKHIEDEETYNANKEQREADEAYKKELKKKKKG